MKLQTLNRREFLQMMAATLTAAGKLPLLCAKTRESTGIDASTGPYAIKPIRDHLSRFSPVATSFNAKERYTLTYDIIHWHWARGKRNTFANSVVGQVVIKRDAKNSKVIYNISQKTTVGGVNNFINAQITCNTDNLGSLRRWRLRSYEAGLKGQSDSISELTEKGACREGQIRISSNNYQYGFETENPVVTQWTILDFLIRKASLQSLAKFDLLQDLSLFKPNQYLIYDGEIPVKFKDAETIILRTYAQTGQGVLPLHYLLDEQGCPQLVTSSIVSWALSAQKG